MTAECIMPWRDIQHTFLKRMHRILPQHHIKWNHIRFSVHPHACVCAWLHLADTISNTDVMDAHFASQDLCTHPQQTLVSFQQQDRSDLCRQ